MEILYNEIMSFLGISEAWEILKSGDYSLFRTFSGIESLVYPIIPFLLLLEIILGFVYKNPQTKVYKVNFLIYIFNRFLGRFIAIGMIAISSAGYNRLLLFKPV